MTNTAHSDAPQREPSLPELIAEAERELCNHKGYVDHIRELAGKGKYNPDMVEMQAMRTPLKAAIVEALKSLCRTQEKGGPTA